MEGARREQEQKEKAAVRDGGRRGAGQQSGPWGVELPSPTAPYCYPSASHCLPLLFHCTPLPPRCPLLSTRCHPPTAIPLPPMAIPSPHPAIPLLPAAPRCPSAGALQPLAAHPPLPLLLQLQHSLHCGCIQVSCLGSPPRFGGKSGEMDQQQAAQGCGLAALCISVGPRAGVSISPAHHRRWSLGFRKLCAQLFPHSLNLAEVGLPGSEGDRGTGEGLTPSLGS